MKIYLHMYTPPHRIDRTERYVYIYLSVYSVYSVYLLDMIGFLGLPEKAEKAEGAD